MEDTQQSLIIILLGQKLMSSDNWKRTQIGEEDGLENR